MKNKFEIIKCDGLYCVFNNDVIVSAFEDIKEAKEAVKEYKNKKNMKRKKYYSEDEDGKIFFSGIIVEELDNGGVIISNECEISCDDENFPEPEVGDILNLYEMPFDRNGCHATGAAIFDGEMFVDEYEGDM